MRPLPGRNYDAAGRVYPVLLLLILVFFLSNVVSAATPESVVALPEGATGEVLYADYFYSAACHQCVQVRPLVDDLAEAYQQVHVRYREVYFNDTNRVLFQETVERYGLEKRTIPLLTIGATAMAGEEEIRSGLEDYLSWPGGVTLDRLETGQSLLNRSGGGLNQVLTEGNEIDSGHTASFSSHEMTLTAVVAAAAVDSINPCAFAVLAILLAYLTSLSDRKRMLQVGVAYIVTVFVVYLISGLGVLITVQALGITGVVFFLAGIIAVAAGLLQMGEAFMNRDAFTLSIPLSAKTTMGRYLRRVTIPSAIVLGGLVSMFELPCTGGIYLSILGLLGDRMTFSEGLPYLILYNCVFVMPLALIFLIVSFGVSPARVDAWRRGTRRGVRFMMGCAMLGLGGAMLLGVW